LELRGSNFGGGLEGRKSPGGVLSPESGAPGGSLEAKPQKLKKHCKLYTLSGVRMLGILGFMLYHLSHLHVL